MIPETDALDDDVYLFVDTETTGLEAGRHGMIELAWTIGLTGRNGAERYEIDPWRDGHHPSWSPEAEAVHGVPLPAVRGAPHRWGPVGPALDFLEVVSKPGTIVVGSNPRFDLAFIGAALPGGHTLRDVETIDLQDLFASCYPEELPKSGRIGLEAMVRRLTGSPNYDQAHTAREDILDAQAVFCHLRRAFIASFVAANGHLPLVADLMEACELGRGIRQLTREGRL